MRRLFGVAVVLAFMLLPTAPAHAAVSVVQLPYISELNGRYLAPDPVYQVISSSTRPAVFTAERFGAGWAFFEVSTGWEYSNAGGCTFYFCDDAGIPLNPIGVYGVRCLGSHRFQLYSFEYGRYALLQWIPSGELAPEFIAASGGSVLYSPSWC